MKNFDFNDIRNDKGLTLIEVLASLVLLAIVITIFMTMMIQSTKIQKTSEDIIDATYIAQSEMEKIYGKIKKNTYTPLELGLLMNDLHYERVGSDKFLKEVVEYPYSIQVQFTEMEELDHVLLMRVVIKVYEEMVADQRLQAQMENVIRWGNE